MEGGRIITASFIQKWASKYPVAYDQKHYDPYIAAGRGGNIDALRKLTEWKNVGNGPRPRKLMKTQKMAFQCLIKNVAT